MNQTISPDKIKPPFGTGPNSYPVLFVDRAYQLVKSKIDMISKFGWHTKNILKSSKYRAFSAEDNFKKYFYFLNFCSFLPFFLLIDTEVNSFTKKL